MSAASERMCRRRALLTPEQKLTFQRKVSALNRVRNTGWTTGMVDAAWIAQRGCCALCTRDMLKEGRKPESMCADHCHTSGVRRALLCRSCNTVLGVYEKHQRTYISIDVYENYLFRFQET